MALGDIPVGGTINTTSEADIYPTHYANKTKGGSHQYATKALMDSVPLVRRVTGMTAAVYADPVPTNNGDYQLSSGNIWEKKTSSISISPDEGNAIEQKPNGIFVSTSSDAVSSVNDKTGPVTLDASDVGAIPTSDKGATNGVATLSSGKVTLAQLPLAGTLSADSNTAPTTAATFAHTNTQTTVHGSTAIPIANRVVQYDTIGKLISTATVAGDTNTTVVTKGFLGTAATANTGTGIGNIPVISADGKIPSSLITFPELPDSPVLSVNAKTGPVTLDASDVGAIPTSDKGALNGVASLVSGIVPVAQLPSQSTISNVSTHFPTGAAVTTGLAGKANSVHTHSSADIADASSDPVANMIPKYDTSLRLKAADPSTVLDVTNKGYVDTQIATRAVTAHTHTDAQVSGLGTASTYNTGTIAGTVPLLTTGGKIDVSMIPAIALTESFPVASKTAMLALICEPGDVAIIQSGVDKGSYMLQTLPASVEANWVPFLTPDSPVTSVNGKISIVTLNSSDVGAIPTTDRGASNGVASLVSGLIPIAQIPTQSTISNSSAQVPTGSAVFAHSNATTGVHGAVSTATANTIAIRDSAGRFAVATPSAAGDVANKGYVDGLAARYTTTVAGSTSTTTYTVTHNLNTMNVSMEIWKMISGQPVPYMVEWAAQTANTTSFTLALAPLATDNFFIKVTV